MAITAKELKQNYLLDMPSMDQTHLEFLDLLEQLQSANKETFADIFFALKDHTEAHFDGEEEAMINTAFLALSEHKSEHTRIVQQFEEMSSMVRRGRLAMAKAFINDMLPDWFRQHLLTMDSELAKHLKTQTLISGAKTDIQIDTTTNTQPEGQKAMAGYSEITPEQAKQIIADDNPLIIDTRDAYSYKEAHIDGAMQSHEQLIGHLIENGDHERPVIVYCYHGNSSKDLAEVLSRAGFSSCYSLAGGFTGWKKAAKQTTVA